MWHSLAGRDSTNTVGTASLRYHGHRRWLGHGDPGVAHWHSANPSRCRPSVRPDGDRPYRQRRARRCQYWS